MKRYAGPFELAFELSRIAFNIRAWRKAVGAGCALLCLTLVATALSSETVTFTVEDKSSVWRLNETQQRIEWELPFSDPRSNDALVIETSNEIFEVRWSFIYWKFDKYKRWNALQEGATYRAVVTGWHVPWIGQYRNIV